MEMFNKDYYYLDTNTRSGVSFRNEFGIILAKTLSVISLNKPF